MKKDACPIWSWSHFFLAFPIIATVMKRQFIPLLERPVKQTEPAWWFIFSRYKLLITAPDSNAGHPSSSWFE